ncbi:MAG: flagellar hook basal-body protein, partial [Deltaproteobacteria bacterium]|nr:flagellar hook basal-body protein [Deltaproteobacteria bacterium]
MSITTALYTATTGLNVYGDSLAIIGHNIANVNTPGFKASRGEFEDLLSAAMDGVEIGYGVQLAAVSHPFVQGAIENTGAATDLGIQGEGLFILKDSAGNSFYTRAGQFRLDPSGNLVNPDGLIVQGLPVGGIGEPANIAIQSNMTLPGQATATARVVTNLDATESVLLATLPADVLGTEDTPGNWFAGANFTTVM